MRGHLISLDVISKWKQRITVEVERDFQQEFDRLKDTEVNVEIKKHRQRRSLSANAYFHALVNKIAAKQGGSDEQTKAFLVCEYGTLMKDADGIEVGLRLPASVEVSSVYPYAKYLETLEENGRLFNVYLMYKQTHLMDSKEMSRLIDGTIEAARELGIETDTPERCSRYGEPNQYYHK